MQANRRSNTKPEVVLRTELHRLGYRYRKDLALKINDVRVRPDIVFTARKVAVFVDGCFWHVCPEHGRQPTTNEWYWTPKLRRNVERDALANEALAAAGWQVVRLWEHVPLGEAVEAVRTAVDK
jgi:DNA mismatch endonuclease (patch repair protein)